MKQQDYLYRIKFINHDELYEIYAKYISHEELMGFLLIEDLVFEQDSSTLVIDPSIERLKQEFEDVPTFYVPIHQIIRIDMVKKSGKSAVTDLKQEGNVTQLPSSLHQLHPTS